MLQLKNSLFSRLSNTIKSTIRSLTTTYTYPSICDIAYPQPDILYTDPNYPKNIDWARLDELGIGIIMRAGQATYEDSLFRIHYANAVHFGVPFGIYWFFQPDLNYIYQLNKFMAIYDSLEVKPNRLYVDIEPIVFTGTSIYPPSKEVHTYWLSMFLQGVYEHTGILTSIYTRQNYWDEWIVASNTRYLYNGMPYTAPQWDIYDLWIASWTIYSENIRMPRDWTNWKIWQYEGGTGRQDGIIGPVDKNYFNGTQDEMIDYFGGKVMTALYNTAVPQTERAKVFLYESNKKLTVTPGELGIDAVIIPMGGMHNYINDHWVVNTEGTFKGRTDLFNAAGIPVIGKFELDAGALLKEQHTAPEFTEKPIRENWILPYLLGAWLVNDSDPHNFDWDYVLSGNAKWKDVKAIILQETQIDGYPAGTDTGDYWQTLLFNYIYNHLRYLIDNGMCPDVPIILYTGGWWLSRYTTYFSNMLDNNKTKLYLQLGQWTLNSTNTFDRLDDIFAWPPVESFTFKLGTYTYPDGYFARILMHEFTGETQKCSQIVDVNNNPATVNLSLWHDTPEQLREFFKISGEVPPIPPVDPALEIRVAKLEQEVLDLTSRITTLEVSNSQINGIINIGIKKIKEFLEEIGV